MDEGDGLAFFRRKKEKNEVKQEHSDEDCDTIDGPVVRPPNISIPAESPFYTNNCANLGIALVFNHEKVEGQPPRTGTNKDRDRIRKVLMKYSFEVRTYDDATFAEISSILEKTAKEDHSHNDCICVIVMSHGMQGKVFAKDMPYPVERLWNPFLGEKCISLINKPKLFFIQACRGEKLDSGAQYKGFRTMSRSIDVPDATPQKIMYTIPTTADLLVMYSTYEGNYSWRSPSNGSWFIQSLCIELENFLERENIELFELLTSVSRRVAYEYQSNVPKDEVYDEKKEMPTFSSTLTKIFYLKIRK